MTISLRAACDSDLIEAQRMLKTAGLPTVDLTADHLHTVAVAGESVVGVMGRERVGKIALLRSLAVNEAHRGQGIASKLINALIHSLIESGAGEVWLLTTDAENYFERVGFKAIDRASAPAAIRATEEFSSLCPANAVLMRRML